MGHLSQCENCRKVANIYINRKKAKLTYKKLNQLKFAGFSEESMGDRGETDNFRYAEWNVHRLNEVPTVTGQRIAINKMFQRLKSPIKPNPIIEMINNVVATGQNPWMRRREFIKLHKLTAVDSKCNVFCKAKIFADPSRPNITTSRSQAIDYRHFKHKCGIECRVNPFHIEVRKEQQQEAVAFVEFVEAMQKNNKAILIKNN
jgi:hypothetical protein